MTERYFKVGAIPQIVRQKSVRDSKRNLLYVGRAFLQYKDYLNLDGLLKETSEKVKNCFYGWVKGNQSIVLKRNDIGDWKIEEEKISYDSKNLPYIKVRVTSDNHENLTDEEKKTSDSFYRVLTRVYKDILWENVHHYEKYIEYDEEVESEDFHFGIKSITEKNFNK